jgi:hypothetical protein
VHHVFCYRGTRDGPRDDLHWRRFKRFALPLAGLHTAHHPGSGVTPQHLCSIKDKDTIESGAIPPTFTEEFVAQKRKLVTCYRPCLRASLRFSMRPEHLEHLPRGSFVVSDDPTSNFDQDYHEHERQQRHLNQRASRSQLLLSFSRSAHVVLRCRRSLTSRDSTPTFTYTTTRYLLKTW